MKAMFLTATIVCILVTLGCKIEEKEITIMKRKADFNNLLFFGTGKGLDGIDPEDLEIKASLKFNTFIQFGAKTSNGTLYVADAGKKLRVMGRQLFILNNKGKLIKKIDTMPNMAHFWLADQLLFMNDEAYFDSNYSGLMVLNTESNTIVHQSTDLDEILWTDNPAVNTNDNSLYLNVPPNKAMKRPAHLLKIDLRTLKKEKVFAVFNKEPYSISQVFFDGNTVIKCYLQKNILSFYDLAGNKELKSLDIKTLVKSTFTQQNELFYSNLILTSPFTIGDKLYVLLKFMKSPNDLGGYCKFFVIDRNTLSYTGIINAEDLGLEFLNLKYVEGSRAFFADSYQVIVFDLEKQTFVKQIRLNNYNK